MAENFKNCNENRNTNWNKNLHKIIIHNNQRFMQRFSEDSKQKSKLNLRNTSKLQYNLFIWKLKLFKQVNLK